MENGAKKNSRPDISVATSSLIFYHYDAPLSLCYVGNNAELLPRLTQDQMSESSNRTGCPVGLSLSSSNQLSGFERKKEGVKREYDKYVSSGGGGKAR